MSTRISYRFGIVAVIAVGAALGIAWAIGLFPQRRASVHANPFGITGSEAQILLDCLNTIPVDFLLGLEGAETVTSLRVQRYFQTMPRVFMEQLAQAGYETTWEASSRQYSAGRRL